MILICLVVLMSDGKPTFTETEYHIMENISNIKDAFFTKIYKFWSIGFGDENTNFSVLKRMSKSFEEKGKFLISDAADGLVQIYTEIAMENTRNLSNDK